MTYDALLVVKAGWGESDFRLVSPSFLAAVRHTLFAQRCAELLADLSEVSGMTGEGLSLNDKAKLARAQLDGNAETETIRAAMFPPDEEVA